MKKVLSIACVAVLLLCLAGCTTSAYTTINSVENSGDGHWNMSYEKFNGNKERRITLSGAEEYRFDVEIVTNSGSLALSVTDSEGEAIYTGSEIPSNSFSFMAEEDGDYIIRFEAENHSGSFSIEWA